MHSPQLLDLIPGAGYGAGKVVDKLPVKEHNKQIIEGTVNQGGEAIEDGTTN